METVQRQRRPWAECNTKKGIQNMHKKGRGETAVSRVHYKSTQWRRKSKTKKRLRGPYWPASEEAPDLPSTSGSGATASSSSSTGGFSEPTGAKHAYHLCRPVPDFGPGHHLIAQHDPRHSRTEWPSAAGGNSWPHTRITIPYSEWARGLLSAPQEQGYPLCWTKSRQMGSKEPTPAQHQW